MTAEWCSQMLDGAPVADVKIVSAQHGSSSSLVVELTYDDEDSYSAPPYSTDSPESRASFDSLDSIINFYPHLSRSARSSVSSASSTSYSSSQLSRSARSSISSTSGFGSCSTLTQSHPSRVFFKGGLNPELAALAPFLQATYRREAEFYHHLAPILREAGVRLPESYFTGVDATTGQGCT